MSDGQMINKLEVKVDKLLTVVDIEFEQLKIKQEEIADDVAKIKEAVYNPDEGLYARIRALESWKALSSKLIWTLFTSTLGLMGAMIIKFIT
jgi:hypothetical protein|tara:strand:+ start:54 stop:329 length:276 start_codon:yes stop_codon:yes gene_type:complete